MTVPLELRSIALVPISGAKNSVLTTSDQIQLLLDFIENGVSHNMDCECHFFTTRPWVKSNQVAVFPRDCQPGPADLLGF